MKNFIITLFAVAVIATGCDNANKYEGYKVLEKRFVKEVNAECIYLEHISSGARVFKIAANDPNKTFSIAFKTPPESDSGTPHIMEHSVLNGSQNFPVKSPFDVLMQGSLNTFLNAMTGSDLTIYPVASMNMKDYFNLMHVYMDAVLKPLIYSDPRILAQEGWHYELAGPDEPLIYKGVVYNEMKGAFSDPSTELYTQVSRHLFPETPYRFSSGGYPPAIPDLTYEDFLAFHRKYYDPSNSYIMLYGDADLADELEFMHKNYLADYDRSAENVTIPLQPPFSEMKRVVTGYPVLEGSDTRDKSYLQLSFIVADNPGPADVMAYDILTDILVNNESGPVKKALQDAGIGKNYFAYSSGDLQHGVYITAQDANEEDLDRFREVVMESLKKVVSEGIDKKAIEGAVNRMEFILREGDSPQKGLNYNFQMLGQWMHHGDPFAGLEFEKPLKEIKGALTTDLFERKISETLLDNNHSLLIALVPEPGLQLRIDAETRAELEAKKLSLSEEELNEIVTSTRELIEYQQRSDTPEALATIPMLTLSDIEKEAKWYEATEKRAGESRVIHYNDFTNGIIYNRFLFDVRVLPQEKLGYAYLLTRLLGKLNTENYEYGVLDNELNIHTGGFDAGQSVYLPGKADANMVPFIFIWSKVMNDKCGKMFDLTGEILFRQTWSDSERLSTLIRRHYSDVGLDVENNGLAYASRRLNSYFSKSGVYNELTRGLEYYWFLSDVVKMLESDPDAVIRELSEVASTLFVKENMTAAVTCNDEDYAKWSAEFSRFVETMPSGSAERKEWDLVPAKKNEGILTTSKVQYVLQGFNFKDLGYEWSGKFNVLNQILSTDWLQTQVRVIGGAYGGFTMVDPAGTIQFISYRDPNLKETFDVYKGTVDYLRGFEADENTMTRFIIGTIASMDRPETPSMKGNVALTRFLEGSTAAERQADRDAVLSTTADDISAMSEMVKAVLDQEYYCVYGNNEKIEANRNLFLELINPFK